MATLRAFTQPTAVLVVTAVVLAWACGPSIRRTHQSDNAFARCFDLDYDPAGGIGEKEQCWSTWLEEHVFNQPQDKIAYARLRLTELESGVSTPGPPGPPGSFDRRPVLDPDAGETKPPAQEGATAEKVLATTEETPPPSRCLENCNAVSATCNAACQVDAGVDETCLGACKKSLEQCFQLCQTP